MAEDNYHINDIIIVGAGPCGLAVAARLRETTPSALFTDSEHQRYHWMRSSSTSRKTNKPIKTTRRSRTDTDRLLSGPSLPPTSNGCGPDIAVLDASSDQWMGAWNKKFKDLRISHLRSPMFFHPDPRDRDGLLGFAYKDGEPRQGELREIMGVVGKGLSKYQRKQKIKKAGKAQQQETTYLDERERHDYYRPSQDLFSSYCSDIIERYSLSSILHKSEVQGISFSDNTSFFTLSTSTGPKYARIVILATGATSKPTLPLGNPFTTPPANAEGSVCHAFNPLGPLPPQLKQKIKERKTTSIAVIGGGLTSAQISALAISSGVTMVFHFTRRTLKTKHFDVDLSWVGKYKNYHLASFWSADSDEERFEMIKTARDGGSVNPEYKGVLCDLIKKGKVVLHQNTEITSANWCKTSQTWTLATTPALADLPKIDHIVFATGVNADMGCVSMMQDLISSRPIEMVGGMPCLTHDLMWDEDCPLFVTGRLAGLRLGPGAGNLEGARQGAERVAWKVGDLIAAWKKGEDDVNLIIEDVLRGEEEKLRREMGGRKGSTDSGYGSRRESDGEVDMRRLGLGLENQFGVLALDNEESEDSDGSE